MKINNKDKKKKLSYRERMTTITVSRDNFNKLKKRGKMGDSMNDLIDQLLLPYKKKNQRNKI